MTFSGRQPPINLTALVDHQPELQLTSDHQQSQTKFAAAYPVYIQDLTVAYQHKPVLWDVDCMIPEGKVVGIIGPNGAGKSTMLKAVMDLVPCASGRIQIYGQSYRKNRHLVGYVPQRESVDWDFPITALDVVTMGRYGKIGWFKPVTRSHREAALEAMARLGMADFAQRQINQLSGGQQQRIFLARALVQDAQIYLMDEPFAGVDASTEKTIIQLLHELRKDGKTVVVIHHDLQTAPEYFDYVILLNMRIVAAGETSEVFTAANLHKTYGGRLTLLDEAIQAIIRNR
jgi:manganese/zinc/iron transport system ATP- binding protein